MEGVRSISQTIFDGAQKFNRVGPSHKFEALSICHNGTEDPTIERDFLVSRELSSWTTSSNTTVDAKLQLVCVTSNHDTSLNLSRDLFYTMMLSLRVDVSVLHMVCHSRDGFHFFPGSTDSRDSILPTWFAGTSRYAALWTCDTKHNVTLGVVIERQNKVFKGLADVVEKFADYIHAPQVLCLAIPVYQMHLYDAKIENALNELRAIEISIGFGPQKRALQWQGSQSNVYSDHGDATATSSIDETLSLSRKVHEVVSKIRNHDRLRQMSARMLQDVENMSHAAAGGDVQPGNKQKKYQRALQKLGEAVPVLQQQIDANANYLAYMKYRAENLSHVIVALLTHEDAAASIDLAASSKKDTSSMKTIAIMTMLFLPATFFAALFAVPMLQWDQSPVIQAKFWVYWAFTLPSTVAVFAIWLGTTTSAGPIFLKWKRAGKS